MPGPGASPYSKDYFNAKTPQNQVFMLPINRILIKKIFLNFYHGAKFPPDKFNLRENFNLFQREVYIK